MTLPFVLAALLSGHAPDPAALALVDTALARMGGIERMQNIERVRYDMMTQWQRTNFDDRPYADYPGFEPHTDVRDYTVDAWRNTRRRASGDQWVVWGVDVVRGDAGYRTMGERVAPLNVAYVDEKRELFTYSGDRVMLAARAAADLRTLPDTSIAGRAHARVTGTFNGIPSTLYLRRSDGLPTLLRFRAAHVNDFGLAPWGDMDVEVWYSNWRTDQEGITLPRQWDIIRAGRPYKRMSVLNATINPTFAPDSFVVSDSIRSVFLSTQVRPMHDVPMDSARLVDGRFADFRSFGAPVGAIRMGNRWVLLETGQAPLTSERAIDWLVRETGFTPAAAIVASTFPGNGGIAHTMRAGIPTHLAPGAERVARAVLYGEHMPAAGLDVVRRGRWLPVDGDSLWLEPFDLPDVPGTLLVWVPSARYLYAPLAVNGLDVALILAHARKAGWNVERIGTLRGLLTPAPAN